MELKGRRRGVSGLKPRGGGRREKRREKKSLRNEVHHADAVVWGPVYIRGRALSSVARRSSAGVLFKPPRFARVMGVRSAETTTTSSGDFAAWTTRRRRMGRDGQVEEAIARARCYSFRIGRPLP